MDNNSSDAQQLIVERINQATNILVTVKTNPSVDELSAALALTLMLNKMDKHATAVFSGAVPPAINFLEPNKTFENTVDSLRDFIIALDKEKADRLRYKVEDDVVKIFITPYRSVIGEKDLQFSQGDFNVEVVVALGVESRDDLDRAITAHGRILHDATTITINNREEHSNLGVIDWKTPNASSICEMLVGLGDQLQPHLLDSQISTALLTGIVAATERFSNKKTSSHVMTVAAELMADGANQQLIANNLQQPQKKPEAAQSGPLDKAAISDSTSQKIKAPEKPDDGSKGEMKVRHDKKEAATPEPTEEDSGELNEEKPAETTETPPAEPTKEAEAKEETPEQTLEDKLREVAASMPLTGSTAPAATPPASAPTPPPAPAAPSAPTPPAPKKEERKILPFGVHDERAGERPNWQRLEPPMLGGTLNATTAEVEEEKRKEAEEEQKHNNVTLEHHGSEGDRAQDMGMPTEFNPTPLATPPTPPSPAASSTAPPIPAPSAPPAGGSAPTPGPAPAAGQPAAGPSDDLEAARRAVNDALAEQPLDGEAQPPLSTPPASSPTAPPMPAGAPPLPPTNAPTPGSPAGLPPMPDFSTLPPLPPAPGAGSSNPPMMPPQPGAGPAQPGMSPLPPTQQPPTTPAPGQISTNSNDPNQFRIPGQ